MTISPKVDPVRTPNPQRLHPAMRDHDDHARPSRPVIAHIDPERRCSSWRQAFPRAEIAVPARLLTVPHAADWVRGHGAYVEVCSDADLNLTLLNGVSFGRLIFQNDNAASRTVWHAIDLGVGRFVVSADRQTLSAMARRPQRVLVDITDEPADDLVELSHLNLAIETAGPPTGKPAGVGRGD